MNATYTIPAGNRDAVEQKLAEMNRKAVKLGTSPIAVAFAHSHIETWKVEKVAGCPEYGMREFSREWLTAEVSGETATVSGWYFRATIHHTTDGNILASIPGYDVPREFRNSDARCNHCGTVRKRSATYLMESKDGLKQVGKSCLGDFLGANDPHKLAAWAEALGAFDSWCREREDGEGRGPRIDETVSLQIFLRACASVITHDGWVSKAAARETDRTATAATAWRFVAGRMTRKELQEAEARYLDGKGDEMGDYAAAHKDMADRTIAWALTLRDLPEDSKNDYLHNLAIIANSGLVNLRTIGLAASMISAYRRATEKAEERAKAPESPSRHVGIPGERLRNLSVSIVAVIDLPPTEFGPRSIIKSADAAGNLFVWFTGSAPSLEVGEAAWMTGSVKKHSEFNGIQQTEMTRCVFSKTAPVMKAKVAK